MPDEQINKLKYALEGKRIILVGGAGSGFRDPAVFSLTLTLEDGTVVEFDTEELDGIRYITWEIEKDG